jgi:hypothetical protein
MRVSIVLLVLLAAAALSTGGCGDIPKPRPPLASCTSSWIPTVPLNRAAGSVPYALAWADGILYQARPESIVASPDDGGYLTTLVANGGGTGIWVEGDNLLYSYFDQLMQVSRSGGTVTTLLDGGQRKDPGTGPGDNDGFWFHQLLDESYFYWTTFAESHMGVSHLWRLSRAGGDIEGFAELPVEIVGGMALVLDGVLIGAHAFESPPAFVAPFGGGPLRFLDPGQDAVEVVAVDSGGAIWNASTGTREGRRDTHQVMLSPSDGSSFFPLSEELPIEFFATFATPDGQGGRYLIGIETFDDDKGHASAFLIDNAGTARRLACDPSADRPTVKNAAIAPGAVYLTVDYPDSGSTMVKVPRMIGRP